MAIAVAVATATEYEHAPRLEFQGGVRAKGRENREDGLWIVARRVTCARRRQRRGGGTLERRSLAFRHNPQPTASHEAPIPEFGFFPVAVQPVIATLDCILQLASERQAFFEDAHSAHEQCC